MDGAERGARRRLGRAAQRVDSDVERRLEVADVACRQEHADATLNACKQGRGGPIGVESADDFALSLHVPARRWRSRCATCPSARTSRPAHPAWCARSRTSAPPAGSADPAAGSGPPPRRAIAAMRPTTSTRPGTAAGRRAPSGPRTRRRPTAVVPCRRESSGTAGSSRFCVRARISSSVAIETPVARISAAAPSMMRCRVACPLAVELWTCGSIFVGGACGLMSPNSTRLAGRTALITGSTGGLGVAIASTLAAEGAFVVVTGRDQKRGDAVAADIRAAGGGRGVRRRRHRRGRGRSEASRRRGARRRRRAYRHPGQQRRDSC